MVHPRSILAMGIGFIAGAGAALFAFVADDAPAVSKSGWNYLVLALLLGTLGSGPKSGHELYIARESHNICATNAQSVSTFRI